MIKKLLAGVCLFSMLIQPVAVYADTESVETESPLMTETETTETETAVMMETEVPEASETVIDTETETAEQTADMETESADALDAYYADDPMYEKEMLKRNAPMLLSALAMDYVHNERFSNHTVRYGIDISSYQGDIDWAAAKADGVEFAIIRAGYRGWGNAGTLVKDTYAIKNIEAAKAQGIQVGVYIYSQATTEEEARAEVDFVNNIIQGYSLDLPLVMDFEYAYVNGSEGGRLYDANLSVTEATNVCLAFCEYAESLGYEAMVYANKSTLTNKLNASAISSKYKIWLAHYTSETTYTGDYDFWQYSESISVNGITGPVDGDFWYVPNTSSSGKDIVTSTDIGEPVLISATAEGIHQGVVQWEAVDEAEWYAVYRKDGAEDKWHYVAKATEPVYIDKNLEPGTTYIYTVRAVCEEPDTRYLSTFDKEGVSCQFTLKAPAISSISGIADNTIYFKWKSIEGADGYFVYRRPEGDSQWKRIGETTALYYKDTTASAGQMYYYTVKAFHRHTDKTTFHGLHDRIGVKGGFLLQMPSINSVQAASYNSVKITWGAVEDATCYFIYRKTTGSGYSLIGKTTGTTYTDKTCLTGTEYIYTVRAGIYDGKWILSSFTDSSSVTPMLGTPVMRDTKKTTDGLKPSWKKVTGADGYYVYRRTTNGSWKKIATVKGADTLYYVDTTMQKGIRYYYACSAYRVVNGKVVEGEHRPTGVSNIY